MARYYLTDLGNGEKLADRERHRLMYVPGIGYHTYDSVRWRLDEEGARKRAQEAARSNWDAVRDAPRNEKAELSSHAFRSESSRGITAALTVHEVPKQTVRREVSARGGMIIPLVRKTGAVGSLE